MRSLLALCATALLAASPASASFPAVLSLQDEFGTAPGCVEPGAVVKLLLRANGEELQRPDETVAFDAVFAPVADGPAVMARVGMPARIAKDTYQWTIDTEGWQVGSSRFLTALANTVWNSAYSETNAQASTVLCVGYAADDVANTSMFRP